MIYINAAYKELKKEVERLFKNLPTVKSATYNARPVKMRFKLNIDIPLNVVVHEVNSEGDIAQKSMLENR